MTYKQLRHATGMTVSQMAAYLGVKERMVRYYESGGRMPSGSVERLYDAVRANSPDFKAWLKEKVGTKS